VRGYKALRTILHEEATGRTATFIHPSPRNSRASGRSSRRKSQPRSRLSAHACSPMALCPRRPSNSSPWRWRT
jgi:hypothetical protein